MVRRYFNRLLRFAAMASLIICFQTSGKATVYVIVIGRHRIGIASDSRWITFTRSQIETTDGIEKVVALGHRVAFMSSGLGELSTAHISVKPTQLAKESYSAAVGNNHAAWIGKMADLFGASVTERLNRLSANEKAQIRSMIRQFGSENGVFESIFAGVDRDGKLRIETVNIYLAPSNAAGQGDAAHFEWMRHETPGDIPNIIISGDVHALRNAFENSASPIGQLPSFQAWWQVFREGKAVEESRTAEALVDLAIRYSRNPALVGYPIFVYTLNRQAGFRTLGSVSATKASDLPH